MPVFVLLAIGAWIFVLAVAWMLCATAARADITKGADLARGARPPRRHRRFRPGSSVRRHRAAR